MSRTLKLGTRKSWLALAQSTWVAREIERTNPGVKVELVGIVTKGDMILDVPLQQVDGKDFFVQELDQRLLAREVDLTVHSLKDLSLDRPKGIQLAAIPKRSHPEDVLVLSQKGLDQIRAGQAIKIGTSAPRRLINLPDFLAKMLPSPQPIKHAFVEIRGNVNTRLSKLNEIEGVILAAAGLERLSHSEYAAGLRDLLAPHYVMILPRIECPSAPGQGALAVECRVDDAPVFEMIHKLNDSQTLECIKRERAVLKEWGGGCHQAVGALAFHHPELGTMMSVRGTRFSGEREERLEVKFPPSPLPGKKYWDGTLIKNLIKPLSVALPEAEKVLFVSHARALPETMRINGKETMVFASGSTTWEKLARRGIFVSGSAEGLGVETLKRMSTMSFWNVPPFKDWLTLTHDQASAETRVLHTYQIVEPALSSDGLTELHQSDYVFWSSFSQYRACKGYLDPIRKTVHSCGPGKTAGQLRAAGVEPIVFASVKEWKEWLLT